VGRRAADESGRVHWVGRSESRCIRWWGGLYRGVIGIAGSKVDDRVGEQAAEASRQAVDRSGQSGGRGFGRVSWGSPYTN